MNRAASDAIRANHSATHLLHKALQEVLGDHVRQAGSAVRPDKLRFDFTHEGALTAEERAEVERRVNQKVFENLRLSIFETPLEEARRLGATMLFGVPTMYHRLADDAQERPEIAEAFRALRLEPLFAEAKEWHGLRRLRLRGLLNANIQGLLIASGQNLKRLLAATGWGRRHAPCGSLVALPRGYSGFQQSMADGLPE